MKDQKRSYRRYKKQVILERRARNNHYWAANTKEESWADFWEEVKAGDRCTWMRSMSVPCSCYICSGHSKYRRPDSAAVKKEIEKLLLEEIYGIKQNKIQTHLLR
jgi:hypothetical protein